MNRFVQAAFSLGLLSGVWLRPLEAAPNHPGDPFDNVRQSMEDFVQEGVIAGAVTLISRADAILSVQATGWADQEAQIPMRPDALFWIASMTKPITAVAVLMLEDEGRLSLDDPVEKHLPEFQRQWMLIESSNERQVLVPAARPITLRDLLTHTSGLGHVPEPRTDSTLREMVLAYAQRPLRFPPGSKWEYSNSGINTLGRVVEVISGISFEQFIDQRIFSPLGMKDTTFWPSPAQARRLAKSYRPATAGQGLEPTGIFIVRSEVTDKSRMPMPAGGLFSTAEDLAAFYQMMLAGGEWRGERLLSPRAVAELTRTQTGDIKTGFTPGMSWGLGFQVVKEPQGVTGMLSPGSFGHGGAYGTQSWADSEKDLILILMIQRAGLPNADDSEVRKAFQEAAIGAFKQAPQTK